MTITSNKLKLSMIVAMSDNRVIGKNNQLPWHLPADLKHFKAMTTGKPILMGRKTYLSIGKPLPNRSNLILTRDAHFSAPGCDIVQSLDQAKHIAISQQATELIIIGGAEVYRQYLADIQTLYLTIVQHTFEGDAYFPTLNWQEWHIVSETAQPIDEKNAYPCRFLELARKCCLFP